MILVTCILQATKAKARHVKFCRKRPNLLTIRQKMRIHGEYIMRELTTIEIELVIGGVLSNTTVNEGDFERKDRPGFGMPHLPVPTETDD